MSRPAPALLIAAGALALGTGFLIRARPQFPEEFGEWWSRDGFTCSIRGSNERNASTCLKTIFAAQTDFRSQDRDGDGINQFWRADVAGLYTTLPQDAAVDVPDWRSVQAIKLIDLSVAAADDRPVTEITRFSVRTAKAGYWFRAIRHGNEAALAPDRFAACAFPDAPTAGRFTFIIDERNVIYRKKLKGLRGVDVFPLNPETVGWEKLD